jgi:glycosyltransferase involved in cell wall biosynthesis
MAQRNKSFCALFSKSAALLIILPPREDFSPAAAGAISLVVRRFALASPGTAVMGTPRAQTFPGIDYIPVRNGFEVWRALRRRRPAVVAVHQQPRLALALASLLPGSRVLLFLHNDPLTMRGLRSVWGRRLALSRLHRVVCVSDHLRRRFMTGLDGEGPAVLPNPLSLDELPPRAVTRAQTILFAGRMTRDKAPDVFIAACRLALPQLPGWSARMIGGDRFGPDSPETAYVATIRREAAASGIDFAGPQPHEAVLAAMAQAAITVVPSRWAEPFGLTALEAMASGSALITSGQGGLAEVAGEAARIVPVDDPAALAAAILDLARDPAVRDALAQAGLARAMQFDTRLIAARLAELR